MIPCIIPARGGSKGIPRKNVMPVGGKPLTAWSIEHALAARCVDEVIVATDDQEIAEVALQCGAYVFWRSAESATDNAQSEMVLQEVINDMGFSTCEAIVFLQATSPIRPSGAIDSAIDLFRADNLDSMFSGRNIEGYVWREFDGNGQLSQLDERRPRQLQSVRRIEENGSIYIFKPYVIDWHGKRLGGKVGFYPMHPLDSFQIDEPEDIPLIESLMEIRCDTHQRA